MKKKKKIGKSNLLFTRERKREKKEKIFFYNDYHFVFGHGIFGFGVDVGVDVGVGFGVDVGVDVDVDVGVDVGVGVGVGVGVDVDVDVDVGVDVGDVGVFFFWYYFSIF